MVCFCSANFQPEICKLIIFSKQFQNGIFRTGLFWDLVHYNSQQAHVPGTVHPAYLTSHTQNVPIKTSPQSLTQTAALQALVNRNTPLFTYMHPRSTNHSAVFPKQTNQRCTFSRQLFDGSHGLSVVGFYSSVCQQTLECESVCLTLHTSLHGSIALEHWSTGSAVYMNNLHTFILSYFHTFILTYFLTTQSLQDTVSADITQIAV